MGSIRPYVQGRFLFSGEEKLYVRGVTYGPFRPSEDGNQYHSPEVIERDFAQIAANGFNVVRTYTVPPPRWFLDIAHRHGLRVMVGLPDEGLRFPFLNDRKSIQSIEERVRAGVSACVGHPAVLSYVIGNEIPAPIVRWYGRHRIERILEQLYRAAKAEDPQGLVTYVNYPTTEYPFHRLCFL
jgi:beta-galactosidase/beta-glucuronidase